MSANIYGYDRTHRWLLIDVDSQTVTSTDDDDEVEAMLDDNEQDKYLIIDRADGIYYDTSGVDEHIQVHEFDEPEEPEEEEKEQDD
jgi:hypothetical protein